MRISIITNLLSHVCYFCLLVCQTIFFIKSLAVLLQCSDSSVRYGFNYTAPYNLCSGRGSKWIRLVGRRTLDIYMLHVFFLPNLRFMHNLLEGQLLLQLATGIIGVVLVIAVCFILSSVIRSSSFLSEWLFGERARGSLKSSVLMP